MSTTSANRRGLPSMSCAELVTAFPARQGVNMLRKATFQGVIPPSDQQIIADESGRGYPLSVTRETRLASNVPLTSVRPPLATNHSCLTPRATPQAGNWVCFSCSIPPLFVVSHSMPIINTTGKLALFWRFSLTTGSLPPDSLATILPPLATTSYDPSPLATA